MGSSEKADRRIRSLYEGDLGRRWERIEIGRPATYLEENIVEGRRRLFDRLREWMGPLGDRSILDAGCGLGTLAESLAREGARVTAADLVPRFIETARRRVGRAPATFVATDFLELLRGGTPGSFETILMVEVLEDYEPADRLAILRQLSDSRVPRIYLAFRSEDIGGLRLWDLVRGSDEPAIRSVELLRWLHLNTPYRQRRQERIRLRNYRAHLGELVRSDAV